MFVPEEFTHLYHTGCYQQLNDVQRLKYNQLFGLRINEQFIMFEEVFIRRLMPRIRQHPGFRNNRRLLHDIESILADEERHTRMFACFNQTIRPDLYQQQREQFTRLSRWENSLIGLLMRTPGLLPALIWLMLTMEELTTAISAELVEHERAGELDQRFINMHQQHLEDERRHVGMDVKFVREIQDCVGAPMRKINAGLFRAVLRSILRPQRSTIQVLSRFTQEEPCLQQKLPEMIRQVTALPASLAFPANLVTAEKLPALYNLATRYPDYKFSWHSPSVVQ
jgi:hypothetical protein